LTTNYVQFLDQIYHQISGIPMGLACATQLANIYVYYCISDTISAWSKSNHIHTAHSYIDDIFIVWSGTSVDIPSFIHDLNSIHPRLRFTFNHHPSHINFLDLLIYKGPRFAVHGQLDTAPYVKLLNNFQYIPPTSAHPPRCLPSFIYAEGLRLLRNSSQRSSAISAIAHLVLHLRARGYTAQAIRRALSNITTWSISNRLSLLQPPPQRKPVSALVLPYNSWTAGLNIPALLRNTITCLPTRTLIAWSRGKTLQSALGLQWPRLDPTAAPSSNTNTHDAAHDTPDPPDPSTSV
jgi:hypothetical protein